MQHSPSGVRGLAEDEAQAATATRPTIIVTVLSDIKYDTRLRLATTARTRTE
ncbi:MAG: hypothetical protein V3R77_06195 [Candidatus Binatia bacterium]